MGVSLGAIYSNPANQIDRNWQNSSKVLVSKLVKANFICLRKLRYLFFQPITCKFCKSKGMFCISQPNPKKYNIGTRISQSAKSRCGSVPETRRQLMAVFRWSRLLTCIKMNIYKKVTVIKLQLQLQICLKDWAPYSWNMVNLFVWLSRDWPSVRTYVRT